MKGFTLIFLISIAFAGCKSVESQQSFKSNIKTESNIRTESNSIKVESTPNAEKPLEELTKKQKQKLDERIAPKIREILNKADEINIYYNIDKETNGFRVLSFKRVPNAGASLSDSTLKRRLLDAFYYDASSDERGSMCYSPRHKITAKHNNKTVEIDICYQCGNFRGNSSYGEFSGAFAYGKKSAPIIDEVIEKYGTDLP